MSLGQIWLRPERLNELIVVSRLDQELQEESNRLNDEVDFSASLDSTRFRRALESLDLIMKLAFIELKSAANDTYSNWPLGVEKVKNVMAISGELEVPILYAKSRILTFLWSILSRKRNTIRQMWILYLTLKFYFLCYLLNGNGILSNILNKSFETYKSSNCTLGTNHFNSSYNQAIYERWKSYDSWLENSGIGIVSIPSMSVVTIGTYSLVPIIFEYFPLVFTKLNPIKLNLLSFLLNPKSFRVKMRMEINRSIEILIDVIRSKYSKVGKTRRTSIRPRICLNQDANGEEVQIPTGRVGFFYSSNNLDDVKLIQLLQQIRSQQLIEPANSSIRWHAKLASLFDNLLLPTRTILFIFCILFQIAAICGELYIRTNNRLKLMSCRQSLGPNGTSATIFNSLPELSSDKDHQNYLNYLNSEQNSILELLRLSFGVEVKYYFWSVAIFWSIFEFMTMIVGLSVWFTFYHNVLIISQVDIIVWLKQLKQQVNDCARSALHLSTKQSTTDWASREDLELRLMRDLLVAYLNFELFRNQHKHFRNFKNLAVAQLAVLTGQTYMLCYLVTTYSNTISTTLIVATTISIVIMLNVYLIIASYASKRIENLMRDIANMLAHCQSLKNPQKLSFLIDLWRRQQLSDQEARKFFASTLLGIHITYEKLFPINAYMALIWLILARVRS